MHRYFTKEELSETEEGQFMFSVLDVLNTAIEDGILENCKAYNPAMTDEYPLDTINDMLNQDADCMLYIPIIGTKAHFLDEAKIIKKLISKVFSDAEGILFEDNKVIIHVNSVSFKPQDEEEYHHNIIFLVKEAITPETNLVS